MTLILPPQLEEQIEAQVRSGRYRDANEVIQASLEALQRELGKTESLEDIDDKLEKGFKDFEAGRFKRVETVGALRADIESRVFANAKRDLEEKAFLARAARLTFERSEW
jgi:putative addiction module CopG family antidote